MSVDTDRPLDAGAAVCPCRHGDVAAEVSSQRPLLERAAGGDREAYARLYDAQVEGVYRYLLAWTGDRTVAEELSEQVFGTALAWLPVIAGEVEAPAVQAGAPYPEAGDIGVWLIAMARDAVAQRRGAGWMAGPAEQRPAPADPLGAVALLGDPEREVVVLRLLLGHSLAHAAHLSGYSQRAVVELQLAACLAIRALTGGGPVPGPPDTGGQTTPRAIELQGRLERWDVDLTGADPELADALVVASSLRLAAPAQVTAPAYAFVERLRAQLTSDDGAAAPRRAAAGGALRAAERAVRAAWTEVSRRPRPWAATGVAAAAIVVILGLQAFGSPEPRRACPGASCPPATTVQAAPASSTAAPLTSIRRRATTTTSLPDLPAPTSAAPAPVPTAPATTAPAATAPRTTRPPPPTTTRPPTTAAAPTTSSTTTTAAPTPST
jgi:DNA-directed RNA polymerase specialized sigma24 family protein